MPNETRGKKTTTTTPELNTPSYIPGIHFNTFSAANHEDLEDFFLSFEHSAAVQNWSDSRRREIFPLSLRGPPMHYYKANEDKLKTLSWEDLKQKFLLNFGPHRGPRSHANRYLQRKQGESELLSHYLYEKKHLADIYNSTLPFKDFLETAIRGMNSYFLEEFAKLSITSFQDLMDKATTHENARAIAQSELPNTAQTPSSPVDSQTIESLSNGIQQLQLLFNTYINKSNPVALTATEQSVTRSSTPPPPPNSGHCNQCPVSSSHCLHHKCSVPSSRSSSPATSCCSQYSSRQCDRDRSYSPATTNRVTFSNQRSNSQPNNYQRQSRNKFKKQKSKQSYKNSNKYSSYQSPQSSSSESYVSPRRQSHSHNSNYVPQFNHSAMLPNPYPYYPAIPPFPYYQSNQKN